MAGLFFCLAPTEGAGLLFCPAAIQPRTSVYSGFYAINAVIPPQPKKRLQDFVGAFLLILPIPAHTIQQLHKPPIHRPRHAGGHTVKRRPSTDTRDTTATPDAVQVSTAAYYNKVYKGAAVRTCYRSMPGGAAYRRPCQPGGAIQWQGRGGWRGTTGGLPPLLFSGFRPIANKGEQ